MNVLSVDFDYFQKVTKKQVSLYPDGVDNNTNLSEIIWGNHYTNKGDALRKIGIMQDEFDKMKELLVLQNSNCHVMIANSHKHIYNFIHEYQKTDEKLGLVNIDMHHDIINDNSEMDCGNWVSYISKEYKTAFNWIANPISTSVYGFDKKAKEDAKFLDYVKPSLDCLEGKQFDAIFLCRSDTWTPPHLDPYFSELCNLIRQHFNEIEIEVGIDKPRTNYLMYEKKFKEAEKNFKQKQEREMEKEYEF